MGTSVSMQRAACVALLLVGSSFAVLVGEHQGMTDLSPLDDGGDFTHSPSLNGKYEGTGYFRPADGVVNFVGPKHGLPGYKESHAWEVGIDLFSPSVWNVAYYRVKYDLKGDHATLQRDWIDRLSKNVAPDCPEGRIDWSLNKYASNNPAVSSVKDDDYNDTPATCMQMLKNFLNTGIYEGLSGQSGFPIHNKGTPGKAGGDLPEPLVRFPLKAGLSSLTGNDASVGKSNMPPKLTYSYTFWLRVTERTSKDANIMEFSTGDGQSLPTIALDLKGATTDLIYRVAQSDSPDYQCQAVGAAASEFKPGFLELSKWHFIALIASKFHATSSKIALYVDGEIGCEKENTSGTTVEPPDGGLLYMSAPGKTAAKAEVTLVNFYPNYVLTPAEVAVQMTIEASDKSFAPGPTMGPKGMG